MRAPRGAAPSDSGELTPEPEPPARSARPPVSVPPAGMEGRSASTGWHRADRPRAPAPETGADESGSRPAAEAPRTAAAAPPPEDSDGVEQPEAVEPARPPEPPQETQDRSASDDRLRAWASSPQAQEDPETEEPLDDFAIIERIVPQTKPRGLLGISFGSIRIDEAEGLPFPVETPPEPAPAAPKKSLFSLFRRDRARPGDDGEEAHEAEDYPAAPADESRVERSRTQQAAPLAQRAPSTPPERGLAIPPVTETDLPGPPPKALRQPYPELRQPIGLKPRRPDPFPELRKPPEQRRPRPEPFPELRKPNLEASEDEQSGRAGEDGEKRPAAGWLSGVLKSADRSVGGTGAAPAWLDETDAGGTEDDAAGSADEAVELVPEEILPLDDAQSLDADWEDDSAGEEGGLDDFRRRAAQVLAQAAMLDGDEAEPAPDGPAAPPGAEAPDALSPDAGPQPAFAADEPSRTDRRRAKSRRAAHAAQLELGLPDDDPSAAAQEEDAAFGDSLASDADRLAEPQFAAPLQGDDAPAGYADDEEEENVLLDAAEPDADPALHPYPEGHQTTPVFAREAAGGDYEPEPLSAEPDDGLLSGEEDDAAEAFDEAVGETEFLAIPSTVETAPAASLADSASDAYGGDWAEEEPQYRGDSFEPDSGAGEEGEAASLRYADLLDPTYQPKRGFMDLGRRSILFPSDTEETEDEASGAMPYGAPGSAVDGGFADADAFAPPEPDAGPVSQSEAEWRAGFDDSGNMERLSFRSAAEMAEARTAVNGHDEDGDDDFDYEDRPAFVAPEPTGRPERAAAVMRSIADANTDYYLPPSKTPGMIAVGVTGALCGAVLANVVYGMLGDIVVPRFMVILIGIQIFGGVGVFLGSLMPGVPAGSSGRSPAASKRGRPDNRRDAAWADDEDEFDADEAYARPSGHGRTPPFSRQDARAAMRPSAGG